MNPAIKPKYDVIWQRTKFCFVLCGAERCTCYPPGGKLFRAPGVGCPGPVQ